MNVKRENSRTVSKVRGSVGVATWKLVLVAIVAIALTAIGGISLQAKQTRSEQTDMDLGFDLPTEEVSPKAAG
jgi:hypothetical protein